MIWGGAVTRPVALARGWVDTEGNKDLTEVRRAIIKSERRNEKLYGFKTNPYTIVLCDDLKHYKKVVGKGGGHGGATYKFGKLIFVTPSKREGMVKSDSIFYHELNHIFYKRIAGSWKPVWFSEALANLEQTGYKPSMGWKKYLRTQPNKHKLLLSSHFAFDLKKTNELYIISYFCGQWLGKKYGLKKVFGFVRKIPKPYNNKIFWRRFERYFGITREELVKETFR